MWYFANLTSFSKLIHSHVYTYWIFKSSEIVKEIVKVEVVLAHHNRFIMDSNNKHTF